MATQESLWPIYQIQEVDARLAALERARAALDDGAALAREAQTRQEAAAACQEGARRAALAVKEAEGELSSVEEKMRRIEGVLYGGKANNPKELQGYENELASLKRRQSTLEDAVLNRMEESDASKAELATARQAEAAARARYEEHVAAYREQLAALDGEKQAAAAERDSLRAQTDPSLLRDYDVATRRHKPLVGLVEQDACGACGMVLPVRLVKARRANPSDEFSCPTCSAHLLWQKA